MVVTRHAHSFIDVESDPIQPGPGMIERIDVPNFGSFKSFRWDEHLRDKGNNVVGFRKMNILFGRNYAGKTTLSRIVRCLETGSLPPYFDDPEFAIRTSSETIHVDGITDANVNVRVYNRDFVAENLTFLLDPEGDVEAFAIIGKENTEIERRIGAIQDELGSQDEGVGLLGELATAADLSEKEEARHLQAVQKLEKKLTAKATAKPQGMKHNPMFRDPNYNTPKIRVDIATVRERKIAVLTEKDREAKRNLLAEKPMADIPTLAEFRGDIKTLVSTVESLVTCQISPSEPIEDLLAEPEVQLWVKEGIRHHRDRRSTCAFCRQELPEGLWQRLDAHFDEASETLSEEIRDAVEAIGEERKRITGIHLPAGGDFYATLQANAEDALQGVKKELTEYSAALDLLEESLKKRKADIFTAMEAPSLSAFVSDLSRQLSALNEVIALHNAKASSLQEDQGRARTDLRLDEVAQFMSDVNLKEQERDIAALRKRSAEADEKVRGLEQRIDGLQSEAIRLKSELTDESQGAERVNEILSNYFGHESIRLEAVKDADSSSFRFRILRGDRPAHNMSEGECSLVAFCYFIAKLEEVGAAREDMIIYVDDPVSSLDSNHIFFVYSLLQSAITPPQVDEQGKRIKGDDNKPVYRYKQLFIATHNLDFLKFTKRLDSPRKDCEHFLVVRREDGSVIELMPRYLKEYVTEFNYLFSEIHICSIPENERKHLHSFYNFGNNLRKFLEAYLFFKFPFASHSLQDHRDRVEEFFRGVEATEPLVQRLTNELSHLGERFDRGVQPMDHAEVSKLAQFVLKRIEESDPVQYRCLLESIGVDPAAGQSVV